MIYIIPGDLMDGTDTTGAGMPIQNTRFYLIIAVLACIMILILIILAVQLFKGDINQAILAIVAGAVGALLDRFSVGFDSYYQQRAAEKAVESEAARRKE